MLIAAIKEFRIQQDEPHRLLRVEWKSGQTMRNFRGAFSQLLKLAEQIKPNRVLLDIDKLPEISVYDQLWLSTYFMPNLLRIPLTQAVVVLSSKRVYNQHVVESLLSFARMLIFFDVQFFTQPEAGMYWLTDNSPSLPVLLAEWEEESVAPPGSAAGPVAQYRQH